MARPNLGGIFIGFPWSVVGAVAAASYMPERMTAGIDVVVLPGDVERASQLLTDAGFTRQGTLSIGGSSWLAPDGSPLDVIEGREDWWPAALTEAATNQDDRGDPILPLPYLALMKLVASRVQDIADVTRMLGRADPDALRRVRDVIREHAPELVEDLESLIALGRLESQ
jgi:hypothetical protein